MSSDNPVPLEQLRTILPGQYRVWVRVCVWMVLVGYLVVTASQVLRGGLDELWTNRDPYAALLCGVALWLERRERLLAAAWLTFTTLWLEALITLMIDGVSGSSGPVFPGLILAIGLLLGGRAAVGTAIATCVLIVLGLGVGEMWGIGAGLSVGDTAELVVLLLSVVASGILLHVIMRALTVVLRHAREQQTQAREMIEHAPDAIVVLDDALRVVEFNTAAERSLGISREQALRQDMSELPLMDESKQPLDGSRQLLSTTHEPERLSATQTGKTLEALFRRITRSNGERGLMMVLRDTTERLAAERRARELQHQLQHAQKLEAVGQLAGGVAHDFNNLLTTVGGYAALIARCTDPRAREYADELLAVQERGATLTRQLLSFARKEVAQPRLIDLARLLDEMKALLRRLVGERVSLGLELQGPCPIFADPGQIEQVMLNLCANARDAMPNGGQLRVVCFSSGPDVVVRVEDTGEGMDAATRRRVFEPFFTTKPRGQGTGLGLSTVHGIVSDSGGRIDVRSETGVGTRFELRWAKSIEQAFDETPRSSQTALSSGQGNILLAEDDEHSRRFVARLLTQAGYRVTICNDGSHALSRLDKMRQPPDLLLTDVMMPGITGTELARKFKQRFPRQPVLFISGYLDEVLGEPFDRVEDLLQQPFQAEELLRRIGRKLRLARGPVGPGPSGAPGAGSSPVASRSG